MANPPPKMTAMSPDSGFLPPKNIGKPSGDLAEQMMSSIRRLRILEERFSLLHRKTQVLEQNMLSNTHRLEDDVKKLQIQIGDLKADISDIKSTVKMVATEMQTAAKRQDVETLKKYISIWEPLNFVTRNEVQRLIQETIEDMQPPQN